MPDDITQLLRAPCCDPTLADTISTLWLSSERDSGYDSGRSDPSIASYRPGTFRSANRLHIRFRVRVRVRVGVRVRVRIGVRIRLRYLAYGSRSLQT